MSRCFVENTNITRENYFPKQKETVKIQQFDQWKEKKISEIHEILSNKKANTYIIQKDQSKPTQYSLSYVRPKDLAVTTIYFEELPDKSWLFKNGDGTRCPTLEGMVKRMMHYENDQPEPQPLTTAT